MDETARLAGVDDVHALRRLAAASREDLAPKRGGDVVDRLDPHRDDPGFLVAGRDARTQASQGEQRSLALSMRLAAYRLLEHRHGQPPVLLLDDVFSELDPGRSAGVIDLLPRGQVFVTSARDDAIATDGRRWHVGEGEVT